eukprot:SAG31_NODE_3088_length_4690_cov_2.363973_7_plen_54_part_00
MQHVLNLVRYRVQLYSSTAVLSTRRVRPRRTMALRITATHTRVPVLNLVPGGY